ncbi:MAG: RbsD/FucU domain-containing protein [Phycisphaerales bacterium]|nr:RbsD/FucU domain-containing protein [Phycisphaerales bacterium]
MLKFPVLHPEILRALASGGHASRVLITDGNYPHVNRPNPRAPIVWANFVPGVLDCCTALQMICQAVPIEAVHLMAPDKTGAYALASDPPIWSRFREILHQYAGFSDPPALLPKPQFNELAAGPEVCLVIATAETAIWANVLLTIGVVR